MLLFRRSHCKSSKLFKIMKPITQNKLDAFRKVSEMYGIHRELAKNPAAAKYHNKWATFYERMAANLAGIQPDSRIVEVMELDLDKAIVEAHQILGYPSRKEFVTTMRDMGYEINTETVERLVA